MYAPLRTLLHWQQKKAIPEPFNSDKGGGGGGSQQYWFVWISTLLQTSKRSDSL